jgi:hypothetical protein
MLAVLSLVLVTFSSGLVANNICINPAKTTVLSQTGAAVYVTFSGPVFGYS